MMKRVILVHGWGGRVTEGWFPWITYKLKECGFDVLAPQLPETERPQIAKWVPALASAAGIPNEDTYFVGHSMGCQTIARYLMACPEGEVGGVVYVAGFFDFLTLDEDEEENVWNEWRNTPIDLQKVRARSPRNIALFSDDDQYVPLSNSTRFEKELGAEVLIEPGRGHWAFSDTTEAPEILESLLKLAGNSTIDILSQ